jgi:methyltransferase family protein
MRLTPSLLLRLNPYRGNRQLGYAAALAKVFGAGSETTHPHMPAEQAQLYSALDIGSAELEVLECLHSLVYLFKPQLGLETGSYRGFSAMAIASGMRRNGRGQLISVDTKPGSYRSRIYCFRGLFLDRTRSGFSGLSGSFSAVLGPLLSSEKSPKLFDFAGESSTFSIAGCVSRGRFNSPRLHQNSIGIRTPDPNPFWGPGQGSGFSFNRGFRRTLQTSRGCRVCRLAFRILFRRAQARS